MKYKKPKELRDLSFLATAFNVAGGVGLIAVMAGQALMFDGESSMVVGYVACILIFLMASLTAVIEHVAGMLHKQAFDLYHETKAET